MRFLFIPCLLHLGSGLAQNIALPGDVVIQNSEYETGKKIYVSDASVRAPFARPASTDKKGQFALLFTGVQNGAPVRLIVSKPGFEVVNTRETQSVILGRIPAVHIIMADTQKLAEAQEKFYRIATEGIAAGYRRKVSILKDGNVELADRLATFSAEYGEEVGTLLGAVEVLAAERERAMESAAELARQLATTDLDNSSDLFRRAFGAFQRGEVDATLALLSQERLNADYTSARADREKGGALIAQANETIRQVYKSLGLKADVLEATMDHRAVLEVLDGMAAILKAEPDAFTAQTQYELALKRGGALVDLARYSDANVEFSRGRELVRKHFGDRHIEQVPFLEKSARVLVRMDSLDLALRTIEEAFTLMHGHEEEALRLASLEDALGNVLREKGDPVAALEHVAKASAIYKAHLPPRHPDIRETLNHLAVCHAQMGEFKQAVAIYEEAFDRSDLADTLLFGWGDAIVNMGSTYGASGDLVKAESTLRFGRSLLVREFGPSHPDVILASYQLSVCLGRQGRSPDALAVLDSALIANDGTVPEDHSSMGFLQHQRGRILARSGNPEASLIAYDRALTIYKKVYGEMHPSVASLHQSIASVKMLMMDWQGALKEDSMALGIYEKVLGPEHWHVRDTGCRIASSCMELGRDSVALIMFRKYLPALKAEVGYETPAVNVVDMEVDMGVTMYRLGELDSARTVLEGVKRVRPTPTRRAEWYLYKIAMDQDREDDALQHLIKSARLFDPEVKGQRYVEVADALRTLATRLGRQDVLKEFGL